VTDEYRVGEVESVFETSKKAEPAGHRVRTATLAVAERGQVEGEDAVSGAGEKRADVMPDP
jgi:hypothetical protein